MCLILLVLMEHLTVDKWQHWFILEYFYAHTYCSKLYYVWTTIWAIFHSCLYILHVLPFLTPYFTIVWPHILDNVLPLLFPNIACFAFSDPIFHHWLFWFQNFQLFDHYIYVLYLPFRPPHIASFTFSGSKCYSFLTPNLNCLQFRFIYIVFCIFSDPNV